MIFPIGAVLSHMTPRTYRALLLASVVLGIFGAIFDNVFPSALPAALVQAQEAHDSSLSTPYALLHVFAGLILLIIAFTSAVGLYKFRSWAPRLALVSTALALPSFLLLGATASSGYSMALNEISSMLWGAVLALAYFSPLRERFVETDR
jgi:hypothetical protein